jgi:adenine deaminase
MEPWRQRVAHRLEAARGERPVDLLFQGGRLVNVFTGALVSTPVAVFDGVVVGFGERPSTEVVDLDGAVLSPGFIDGHIHLESSMLLPAEFARAALAQGTTTVVADPHEIANVGGVAGVRFLLDASEHIGLEIYFMAPSCVPATPLETAGAELNADDLELIAEHPRVLGLAEMMNYPGVVQGQPAILDKLERFRYRVIDGHAPGVGGVQLDAYLCAGIGSDHECTRLAEAEEKLAKGMHIMLREGSQARDLEALVPLVTPRTAHRCMLVTDDCDPHDLLEQGHMNRVLKRAMNLGMDPLTAIQLVSINPARYFGLRWLGAIAPGFQADMVVLRSLGGLEVERVYKRGELVALEGRMCGSRPPAPPQAEFRRMNLEEIAEEDVRIPCEGRQVRAIGVAANTLLTSEEVVPVTEVGGEAVSDPERDLLKVAVLERHRNSGRRGLGFVSGLGLRQGALASSVAHDSHNLVVLGASDADMVCAANVVRGLGGGLVVVRNGEVLAELPLPVAGLMSDGPVERVVACKREINQAARALGVSLDQPFMALSFLALPVIPKLKLTDLGLVDVERFTHVPLFV